MGDVKIYEIRENNLPLRYILYVERGIVMFSCQVDLVFSVRY